MDYLVQYDEFRLPKEKDFGGEDDDREAGDDNDGGENDDGNWLVTNYGSWIIN